MHFVQKHCSEISILKSLRYASDYCIWSGRFQLDSHLIYESSNNMNLIMFKIQWHLLDINLILIERIIIDVSSIVSFCIRAMHKALI